MRATALAADRHQATFLVPLGLDEPLAAVVLHVAVIEQRRFLGRRRAVLGVEADVHRDVVHVAVVVEVHAGDRVPPAEPVGEPGLFRGVGELAAGVEEQRHRPPLEGDEQVLTAVTVGVGPQRRGDESHALEPRRDVACHVDKPAAVVSQQTAAGGLRVLAGDGSAADKEVEIAIGVEVARHGRAARFARGREHRRVGPAQSAAAVIQVKPVSEYGRARLALDTTAGHEQVKVAIAVGIEPQRRHVLGRLVGFERGLRDGAWLERPVRLPEEDDSRLASRSADEEVVVAVTVGIAPGQAAAKLRELARQQRLAGIIVVRFFAVLEGQADALRDLGEKGFRFAWLGRLGRLAATRLGDCVAVVGGKVVEGLHLPAWPTYAEGVDGVRLAKAKVHRRVIAGEEPGHRVGQADLFPRLALDLDSGTETVTVAPGTN